MDVCERARRDAAWAGEVGTEVQFPDQPKIRTADLIAGARQWAKGISLLSSDRIFIERLADALESRNAEVSALREVIEKAKRLRQIHTEMELDSLPERSVIIDHDGDVWQRRGYLWCGYEVISQPSWQLARHYLPATILSAPAIASPENEGDNHE